MSNWAGASGPARDAGSRGDDGLRDRTRLGTTAVDGNDNILYDASSGELFYDSDGFGAAAPILFATVSVATALTHADFEIV
jgi:Ca2+-binding RTX toxin-like protein